MELQLYRRYMIFSIEGMNLEGIDVVFLTLHQCPRTQIYTVVPFVPLDAPTAWVINNGLLVATVAYVGIDADDVVGIDAGDVIG